MIVKTLIVKPHRAHYNSNNDFSILIHEEESKFFLESVIFARQHYQMQPQRGVIYVKILLWGYTRVANRVALNRLTFLELFQLA